MQDKEFDQLFKNRLEDAELEAPAMAWNKIEAGLDTKKTKKPLPIYWMAAALAVAALTAGLLFQDQEKMQLQGPTAAVSTEVEQVSELAAPVSPAPLETGITVKENAAPKRNLLAMQPSARKEDLTDNTEARTEPADSHHQPIQEPVKEAPMPQPEVLLAEVIHQAVPEVALDGDMDQPEKRGIRNVGDLVNFVVDKVDKREEKMLQFNTDQDDESSLVAINIGIIKFNSKQKAKR